MWIIIGIALFLLLLPVLVGLGMAARQQVTRVELVKAPLQDVWDVLNDLPAQTYWRADVNKVQMLDDDAGIRWVEYPEHGSPVTLRKVKEVPTKELLLEMTGGGSVGSRSAKLSSTQGGTRITFVEILDSRSPLQRIKARMGGGLDKKLDQFIQQLKQKFAA
jgi:carbon monoxide dehydrogenase subunit G